MSKVKFSIFNFQFSIILLLFLIWRAVDFWALYLAEKIVPYLGFFAYPKDIYKFELPQLISSLANFDGIHYLKIAQGGYGQWEQAFFPFYPLLIRLFSLIYDNALIVGITISNLSFLIGLFFVYKLVKRKHGLWFCVFLLAFPTSFFFGAVYTEGLFFLLFVLVLYFLKKKKYWLVSLFAILCSLTRLVGVFLIIPILFHLIQKSKVKSQNYKLKIKSFLYLILNTKHLILILSPFIGLAIYCFYLWQTTGDPFFFLTSQPIFGANRSASFILLPQVIWRYIKIFITASHNFQFYVSLFELLVFILVLFVLVLDLFKNLKIKNWKLIRNLKLEIRNYERIGLSFFSFANILLPTLTGTFSSIPRYALFSLSFFVFLSEIKSKWIKIGIAIAFLIIHLIITALFGQGYFIS